MLDPQLKVWIIIIIQSLVEKYGSEKDSVSCLNLSEYLIYKMTKGSMRLTIYNLEKMFYSDGREESVF